MITNIPPAAEVRIALKDYAHAKMQALSAQCGVPFTTLWKIKTGDTPNPGIETVRKFWPFLAVAQANRTQAATETVAAELPVDRSELVKLIEAGLIKDPRQHTRRTSDRKRAGK